MLGTFIWINFIASNFIPLCLWLEICLKAKPALMYIRWSILLHIQEHVTLHIMFYTQDSVYIILN